MKVIRKPFLMADGGTGSGEAPESENKVAEDGNKDAEKPKSFEEILKGNKSFQAELDRRINKAVETATANERDRQKIIQDKMQDEMIRVSKMTDDEREAYTKEKAEEQARQREADLTKRELTLDARSALAEKKLPDEFTNLLVYTDKESCMKSIDTLEQAFKNAVQTAVNDKLKGSTPPKDAKSEGEPAKPRTAQEDALAEARKLAGVKHK